MNTQLMSDSSDLLIYGMGVVFCFLILLVIVTSVTSRVVNRFFPEAEPQLSTRGAKTATVDPLTIKIIQAAVDQHRGKK